MFTEATLDFPEEDVEFVRASDAARKLAPVRADVDAADRARGDRRAARARASPSCWSGVRTSASRA